MSKLRGTAQLFTDSVIYKHKSYLPSFAIYKTIMFLASAQPLNSIWFTVLNRRADEHFEHLES